MATKSFTIYFARSSVGREAAHITAGLSRLHGDHGANLPAIELGEDHFQVRDLERVRGVWKGVFGKLRHDAPHVVNANGDERELTLDHGDRLIDKCHFLYREGPNVLVWQNNRTAGSINKFATYLANALGGFVTLPLIMNQDEITRIMEGDVRYVSFEFDRPDELGPNASRWKQGAFDLMSDVHAAHAKFELRAPRLQSLGDTVKRWVRGMVADGSGASKVRVKVNGDSDPVELFMAPLKESITVNLRGRYPDALEVYQELEAAYGRKRNVIPRGGDA